MWRKRLVSGIGIGLFVAICMAAAVFSWHGSGWKALSVPTGSMRPSIPPTSLVIVHKVSPTSLRVGDIITYANPLHPGQTISHRIVRSYLLNGKIPAFVTKGDANKVADLPITEGSVVGKVVGRVPDVGGWLLWAKSWPGLIALVYVPALLLMRPELRRLSDYYRWATPYRLYGFRAQPKARGRTKYALSGAASLAIVLGGSLWWQPALALLKSNTVTLAGNHLAVAASQPPSSCTSTNSHNSVTVTNNNSQTASSGNTSSNGNTNGGNATSGNASNTNSSTTTVTVTNNC